MSEERRQFIDQWKIALFQHDTVFFEQGLHHLCQHETPAKLVDLLISLWSKHYVTASIDYANLLFGCVRSVETIGSSERRKTYTMELLKRAFMEMYTFHPDHTIETFSKYKLYHIHNHLTQQDLQTIEQSFDPSFHHLLVVHAHPDMIPYILVWAYFLLHRHLDKATLLWHTLLSKFDGIRLQTPIHSLDAFPIPTSYAFHIVTLLWKLIPDLLPYIHEEKTTEVYQHVWARMAYIYFYKTAKRTRYERFPLLTTLMYWITDSGAINTLQQFPFYDYVKSKPSSSQGPKKKPRGYSDSDDEEDVQEPRVGYYNHDSKDEKSPIEDIDEKMEYLFTVPSLNPHVEEEKDVKQTEFATSLLSKTLHIQGMHHGAKEKSLEVNKEIRRTVPHAAQESRESRESKERQKELFCKVYQEEGRSKREEERRKEKHRRKEKEERERKSKHKEQKRKHKHNSRHREEKEKER